MVRTRVGYTGGTTADPTYRRLGDHTEAFEVEYDPVRISYDDLLSVFWQEHSPGRKSFSKQYRAAVFTHDEEQRKAALASRQRLAASEKIEVATAVEEAGPFYPAEDYHQKYYLRRQAELFREYRTRFPDHGDFVRSTAVARVNGYLGGNGTLEDLEAEIDRLGLSESGRNRLKEYVKSSPQRACPLPARP